MNEPLVYLVIFHSTDPSSAWSKMYTFVLFALLATLSHTHAAPSIQARAGEVLYELSNAGATV